MVIDPQSAQIFINGYSILLAEVYRLSHGKSGLPLLKMLSDAREVINSSPSIIGAAVLSLERKECPVPQEIISAVKSLQLKQWVYLRDTTRYSVFLDPSGKAAYAVLGLTNRIRDLLSGSAVSFQTGVVEFAGHFVCDGVVSNPVWLGANYRRDFSAHLAMLKKEGRFFTAPIR
jgi:hypothetical protein